MPLPHGVADDGGRFAVVRDPASQRRGDPEHIAVVGSDDFSGHEAAAAVHLEVRLHRERDSEA